MMSSLSSSPIERRTTSERCVIEGQLTFARKIRRRKRGNMSKMKFSNYQATQSRIVEGVCVPNGDYDELLREAVRVALRKEMSPACVT
jgi:hypothetical protein